MEIPSKPVQDKEAGTAWLIFARMREMMSAVEC